MALNYSTKEYKDMDIKKGKIRKIEDQSKSPNTFLIGIPKRENRKKMMGNKLSKQYYK